VLRIDFGGIEDVDPLLAQLRIEGTALGHAANCRRSVYCWIALRMSGRFLDSLTDSFPTLAATATRAADFSPLLREFSGKIRPDGTLDDRASPALYPHSQGAGKGADGHRRVPGARNERAPGRCAPGRLDQRP